MRQRAGGFVLRRPFATAARLRLGLNQQESLRLLDMDNRLRSILGGDGQEFPQSERPSLERQLRHFRNVNSNLIREALKVWDDLWGEMEGRVVSGVVVLPQSGGGFKPRCGWPEFLERMWLLRYYLDSVRRFSEQ